MRASFLSFSLPARRRPSSSFCPGGVRSPVPIVLPQVSASSVASSNSCATLIASACKPIGRLRFDLFQIFLQLMGLLAQQRFGALDFAAHAFFGFL